MMRPGLFIDTSAYVATLKRDDEHHFEASAILKSLARRQAALFTTNFVVAETHAMLMRFLGVTTARAFLKGIHASPATVIVRADEEDEQAARDIIFRYLDKDFSLVDAISFTVMERLGIRQAFTFDGHFKQYGFDAVVRERFADQPETYQLAEG